MNQSTSYQIPPCRSCFACGISCFKKAIHRALIMLHYHELLDSNAALIASLLYKLTPRIYSSLHPGVICNGLHQMAFI